MRALVSSDVGFPLLTALTTSNLAASSSNSQSPPSFSKYAVHSGEQSPFQASGSAPWVSLHAMAIASASGLLNLVSWRHTVL